MLHARSCRRGLALTACLFALVILLLFTLGSLSLASPGTTERVSVDSAGNQGNGSSCCAAMSAHGRYVAFASRASNLVPSDTNGVLDVFVRDRQTGMPERVSVDTAGNEGDDDSGGWGLAICADGRYVAFDSDATNFVPGDTNGAGHLFVHDRETGVTERVGSGGFWPSVSADGRYVAFTSWASDLVADDTNAEPDVFVHDRETGITERVSVDSAGNQANGQSFIYGPSISADGRYMAFVSTASNLVVSDTNAESDVFVHDRETGITERVSVDSAGNQGDDGSGGMGAAISADGRYVAFDSYAPNLVPGDTNGYADVFVHNRGAIVNQPPVARFTMCSDSTCVSENGTLSLTVPPGGTAAVHFSAADSTDPDGGIASYNWLINASPASTSVDFSVALGAGTHNVLLSVTDSLGATTSAGAIVVVSERGPPGPRGDIPLSDGFDYPISSLYRPTREKDDGDRWFATNDFGNFLADPPCTAHYHPGDDWNRNDGKDAGETVTAVSDGKVAYVKQNMKNAAKVKLGDIVVIAHSINDHTVYSVYVHVQKNNTITPGVNVARGQPIGIIGRFGFGAHLHFEMRTFFDAGDAYPNDDGCGYYADQQTMLSDGFIDPVEFIDAHRPQ